MKATLRLPHAATYAEYLAVEQHSEHRHELINGVIVAMAGASDEHNAIAGKLAMLVGMRLPSGCRYYTPDQRFWIAANARSRYADGSIICGKPGHPVHDPQATTNPVVVIEVLSPSSEGDDDGEKRRDFQSLSSLQAYVLVHQDSRSVRVYRRDDRGEWCLGSEGYGSGDAFALPSLHGPIPVDAVYEDILDAAGRSMLR
ncbi:MAG: Uma2 family endonuclease [Polyangiaceae bacterium]|nr:Uma2 family endonuclease [Polyangiaceae bacterium]